MKLAVLTILIGEDYQKKWKSATVSKEIYCKRHNYDFILITETLDKTRKPHWSKIKALEKYINKYDWIFHSDSDAHIMNFDTKIEDIINEYSSNNFMIITKDKNMINSGNFLIKNTKITNEFLTDVYKSYPPQPIKINKGIMRLNDQYGIYVNYQKKKYKKQISIIPQRKINSYPCSCCGEKYITGDFLIHFVNHKRPTHNWDGSANEPYIGIELAEAKSMLYQYEKLFAKLKKSNYSGFVNFKNL